MEHVSRCVDSPIINLVKNALHAVRQTGGHGEAKWRVFPNYSHQHAEKAILKWVIYKLFSNLHMHVFRVSVSRRPLELNIIMLVWMGYFQTGPIFGYDIMKPILKYHGNVLRTFENYKKKSYLVSSFNLHHISSLAKGKTQVTRVPCIIEMFL